MGLDMYLQKAKRIGNVTPRQLESVDGYYSYLERRDEYESSTLKSWCGIDIEEIDMSVIENYKDEYIHRYACWDEEKKFGWKTVFNTIASWRKANHIHKWFVDNVQDGIDNCGTYEVTKEQLEELLNICKEVADKSKLVKGKVINGQTVENGRWINNYVDGEYIENPSVAQELLPTTSGFFFGNTKYDQWYLEDVKHTIGVIEDVLNTTNFEHEIVMYSSSW